MNLKTNKDYQETLKEFIQPEEEESKPIPNKKTKIRKIREYFRKENFGIHEVYLVLLSIIVWSGFIAILVGYWDLFMVIVLAVVTIPIFILYYVSKKRWRMKKSIGEVTKKTKIKFIIHTIGIFFMLLLTIGFTTDHIKYTKLAYTVQKTTHQYTVLNRCTKESFVTRCVKSNDNTIRVYTIETKTGKLLHVSEEAKKDKK